MIVINAILFLIATSPWIVGLYCSFFGLLEFVRSFNLEKPIRK